MDVRQSDGREIIGAVEVSWTMDFGNVARAQRPAEVLTKRGLIAVPVRAGDKATQTAEQAAQQGECALLLDGRFKYPSAVRSFAEAKLMFPKLQQESHPLSRRN